MDRATLWLSTIGPITFWTFRLLTFGTEWHIGLWRFGLGQFEPVKLWTMTFLTSASRPKTNWTRGQFGSRLYGLGDSLALDILVQSEIEPFQKCDPLKAIFVVLRKPTLNCCFFRCRNIRPIWLAIIQCACTYIRRTLFGLPAVPIISKGHGGGSGSARMDWVFLTSVSNVILPGQEAKLVKSGCAKPMKLNRRHYERKLTVITLIF